MIFPYNSRIECSFRHSGQTETIIFPPFKNGQIKSIALMPVSRISKFDLWSIMEGGLASQNRSIKITPLNQSNCDISTIHTRYYISGNINEWRYKTGIDGEPAVSFRLALYDTKSGKLIWSGIGANNVWGKGSIGTTAQSLIEEMFN